MKEKLKNGLMNLRGMKIGCLRVVKRIYYAKPAKWTCICEGITYEGKVCGKEIVVLHSRLTHPRSPKTHCGCQKETLQSVHKKEYHAWWDAKNRCHNENHPSYKRYGAKGIRMCQEWQDSFERFFKDVGKCPKGMSLDRINAFGNYEQSNCRWATDLEQARNKKDTKFVKHPKTGKPVRAADLADEMGLTYQQMRNKLINEGNW